MKPPSVESQVLALLALLGYAMATVLAMLGRGRTPKPTGKLAMVLLAAGISLNLASLALRLARGCLPTHSGFDSFTLLALLAGASGAYLQAVGALPMVAIGLLPLAATGSLLAVALSGAAYRDFARDVWTVSHAAMSVAAVASLAAAAGAGLLYLRKHKHLRTKDPDVLNWRLPSLERLARFLRHVMPTSFALLTATVVTGAAGALQPHHYGYLRTWWHHPKILVATVTWLIYAYALHAAFAKRIRVRTAALLSAAAFFLLIAVMVGSMLLPKA